MSDIREAEGNQGNAGFASEWQRLAREEDRGQEQSPSDDDRLGSAPDGASPDNSGQAATPPSTEAAPPAPATADATDDIWATAPEQFRLAHQREKERLEQLIRSNGGRASKAEREAAELRARLVAQPAPTAQAPQQGGEGTEVPDRLKAVREEYEDVAGPLVDEIVALRETVSRLSASQASAEEQQRARDELELKEFLAGEEQRLSEAHSDWREVVVSPEFAAWVRSPETPQFVRDGIARNGNGIVDGSESARLLEMFKAERGIAPDPLAARRQRQLEGGRAVPARTPGATPSGSPDDFRSEWQRLREQERRQRQRAT